MNGAPKVWVSFYVWATRHGLCGLETWYPPGVGAVSDADPTHDDKTVMNGAPKFLGGPPTKKREGWGTEAF
jgi:hypothetical protein